MDLAIKTTTRIEDAASFVASSILDKLKSGKHVLFFVTGGSSISVGVKIAELLRNYPHKNLTVALTDERYGPVEHINSNLFQLIQQGFNLPQAKIIPILTGKDRATEIKNFNEILNEEFIIAEYKIGLFGLGRDGHTAGILPDSKAVYSEDLVFGYSAPVFSRITITPKAIEKLDEAVVWAQGEDKWDVLKSFQTNIDIIKQPAQVLKKIPLLTIFTDYKK